MNDHVNFAPVMNCIPTLLRTVEAMGPLPAGLILAAATPRGGKVILVGDWPQLDRQTAKDIAEQFNATELAMAVAASIEEPQDRCGEIWAGLSLLLGKDGMAAAYEDAEDIVRAGKQALLILLVENCEDQISWLATMTELEPATIH